MFLLLKLTPKKEINSTIFSHGIPYFKGRFYFFVTIFFILFCFFCIPQVCVAIKHFRYIPIPYNRFCSLNVTSLQNFNLSFSPNRVFQTRRPFNFRELIVIPFTSLYFRKVNCFFLELISTENIIFID